ncbi:MAG: hypothetical protein AAFX40_06535, partial [Cyanobacteria bacterium J06639_1]
INAEPPVTIQTGTITQVDGEDVALYSLPFGSAQVAITEGTTISIDGLADETVEFIGTRDGQVETLPFE